MQSKKPLLLARHAIFVLVVLSISSCTVVNITSRKDPTLDVNIDRIFVILETKNGGERFNGWLIKALSQTFTENNLDYKIWVNSGLELDENALQNEMDLYSPRFVLMINLEGALVMSGAFGSKQLKQVDLDVIFMLPENRKAIWRSNVSLIPPLNYIITYGRTKQMCKKLLLKMREDGLIK